MSFQILVYAKTSKVAGHITGGASIALTSTLLEYSTKRTADMVFTQLEKADAELQNLGIYPIKLYEDYEE